MKKEIYLNYSSSFGKNEKLRLYEINKRTPYLEHLIKRYFMKDLNSLILDLACGYGALSLIARRHGYKNILGVDISKEEIEIGKKIGNKDLINADIFDYLHSSKKKFDLIICQDLIEHLNRNQISELFELMSSNLSKGGFILIHTINGDSPFFGQVLNGDVLYRLTISFL